MSLFNALMSWGKPQAPIAAPQLSVDQMAALNIPATSAPVPGNGLFNGFLGQTLPDGTTTQGWGMPAIQGASALGNLYLGMKQYGLAKDGLAENKRQFGLNFGAQRNLTNSQLADRQAARVASNPNAYQSVGDYMDKYGIR